MGTAEDAIAAGEFPGVALVITDGEIRVKGSLSTLRSARVPKVESGR